MMKIKNLKFHIPHSHKGFTLVELILYIALLSIFITGAIQFSWDIIYGRVKVQTQQELSQNLRLAGQRIAYEIRNATAVTNVTANSITLAFIGDATRHPTVINVVSNRLQISYGGSGPCVSGCFLTSDQLAISNLTFTNLSSGVSTNVKVSITGTLSGDRSEFDATETYVTSAELRSN